MLFRALPFESGKVWPCQHLLFEIRKLRRIYKQNQLVSSFKLTLSLLCLGYLLFLTLVKINLSIVFNLMAGLWNSRSIVYDSKVTQTHLWNVNTREPLLGKAVYSKEK